MTDWSVPFDYITHGMTLSQLKLLSWARTQRIRSDRQWQMTVASLPLQEDPQDFYDRVMGLVDDGEDGREHSSGSSSGNSRLPYLHDLTEFQAELMGLPIKFVDVKEEASGEHS